MPSITPNLWFDTQSLEAAEFYCSVFPNSRVVHVSRYGDTGPREKGSVLSVEFELDGRRFVAINGGPEFTFSEAVSFAISCAGQEEIDHYWDALSDGGEEQQCGWLKDRYGLSWQVVPEELAELMTDPDAARSERVMSALLGMVKIDVAALHAAADGTTVS